MSFTTTVKNEVSKLELSVLEKIAQLSAIIRNSSYKTDIKIVTENASVARQIFSLIKDLYKITPLITVRKGINYQKKYLYILQIKKSNNILSDVGLLNGEILNIPLEYITDDEESLRAYLRGLFIMTGSINDPKKSRYHLEFLVDDEQYANYVCKMLNKYYLNSKVLKKENKYMIYIKEAEKIGDFLRIINAYNAVMYYEDIRIYRDHKNMTNRLNNCEQANIDKVIETSNEQLKDINLIIDTVGLDLLDEKEQIVIDYRLKYNDASLLELSEIIGIETGKKITKSGLYHRFKKIKDLASKIRENTKQ
ncbi:MAG: DNA-binding protein WhiA [Bacilli bacterium]